MVTLPFLSLLVSLPPSSTYTIVYTTSIWIWTLTVIRNIQRVAVAGVVGGWYFRRHETDYMNDHVQGGAAAKGVGGLTFESTRRAVGTSLGTVLLASAVTSVFTFLQVVLNSVKRGVKSALSAQSRSTSFVLGVMLTPLEMLIPVINILKGFVEMFNGWGLVYTGLTGEGYASSCRKSRDLLRGNRTVGLGDSTTGHTVIHSECLLTGSPGSCRPPRQIHSVLDVYPPIPLCRIYIFFDPVIFNLALSYRQKCCRWWNNRVDRHCSIVCFGTLLVYSALWGHFRRLVSSILL